MEYWYNVRPHEILKLDQKLGDILGEKGWARSKKEKRVVLNIWCDSEGTQATTIKN